VNDNSHPVGSASSRLIVIRGNSGSGKSAVAAGVRAGRPHGTLAVVGQDVVRRTILGTHDDKRLTAVGLID
jgi:predicted kinase